MTDRLGVRIEQILQDLVDNHHGSVAPWARSAIQSAIDDFKRLTQPHDAVRYRWLRDNGHIAFLRKGEEVDKLVDAEMAKPPVHLEI